MIHFIIMDEVDRIIELNQFVEIKEIFHYINTVFLKSDAKDELYEESNEIRNMVEYEG